MAVAQADAHLAAAEPSAAIAQVDADREPVGFADALERIVMAKAHLMLDQPDAAFDLLDPRAASARRGQAPRFHPRSLDRGHR